MTDRINTTLDEILEGIKARLISSGLFHSTTVYLGIEPEATKLPPTVGYYAVVTPQVFSMTNPETNFYQGTIDVTLYTSSGVDQAYRNNYALGTSDQGLFPKITDIAATLRNYDLELTSDDDVYWLLARPLQLRGISDPKLDQKSNRSWSYSTLTVDVAYTQDTVVSTLGGDFSSDFNTDYDI